MCAERDRGWWTEKEGEIGELHNNSEALILIVFIFLLRWEVNCFCEFSSCSFYGQTNRIEMKQATKINAAKGRRIFCGEIPSQLVRHEILMSFELIRDFRASICSALQAYESLTVPLELPNETAVTFHFQPHKTLQVNTRSLRDCISYSGESFRKNNFFLLRSFSCCKRKSFIAFCAFFV